MFDEYKKCILCPRKCGVNRYKSSGYCGSNANLRLSYYSLHLWEEPVISGDNGSGTIFFTNCNLSYSNFSGCNLRNIKFDNCKLDDASFNEVKWKNLEFIDSSLIGVEFIHTKLKDLDVSSCVIKDLKVPIEYLKGLVVSYDQALELSLLLGIKIK